MRKILPFPYQENIPLHSFSTFGIGGPAEYFTTVTSLSELRTVLTFCHQEQLPFFVLGKGSNSLFDDRGFKGIVIYNKIDFFEQKGPQFIVGSAFSFARLGQITAKLGFSGLEFAAGIPATVGGAIFMNAGANGQQSSDTLQEIHYLSEEGKEIRLAKNELQFGYRTSSLQKRKGVIVEATFLLTPSTETKGKQRELLEYRIKTQPYSEKSCGCIFQNPKVGGSAGRLIEECGLKGFSVGGASISSLHANFIINSAGATARDVLSLIGKIKEKVYAKRGIVLEEEIRFIPYE